LAFLLSVGVSVGVPAGVGSKTVIDTFSDSNEVNELIRLQASKCNKQYCKLYGKRGKAQSDRSHL